MISCRDSAGFAQIVYEMDLRKAGTEYQLEISLAYSTLFQRRVFPFFASVHTLKQLISKEEFFHFY